MRINIYLIIIQFIRVNEDIISTIQYFININEIHCKCMITNTKTEINDDITIYLLINTY